MLQGKPKQIIGIIREHRVERGERMTVVLSAGREIEITNHPTRPDEQLWMTASDLRAASGWSLKPEGLCKDDTCVPLAAGTLEDLVDGEAINVSGLWENLDRPILHDAGHTTWMLGESAEDRARRLESLQAPDFTLPDIDGKPHSLSDYRGKKVLLASWASW
jgi:hypothetical protein